MAFEIFVLDIVNDMISAAFQADDSVLVTARARLNGKIALLKGAREESGPQFHPFCLLRISGRRRYSGTWHEEVVQTLARHVPDNFPRYLQRLFREEIWFDPRRHDGARHGQRLTKTFRIPPARFPESRTGRLGAGVPGGHLGVASINPWRVRCLPRRFLTFGLPSCLMDCGRRFW